MDAYPGKCYPAYQKYRAFSHRFHPTTDVLTPSSRTIAKILGPTIVEATGILPNKTRRDLAQEARQIFNKEPDSQDRVRNLFRKTKERLSRAWIISLCMTIVLFSLFVGMLLAAVITGLVLNEQQYSIIFGGVSVGWFISVIVWKPYDRVFLATITIQKMEMILNSLELEWATCEEIADPVQRADRIREANGAALTELAKLASA